jgi:hypothetical protein
MSMAARLVKKGISFARAALMIMAYLARHRRNTAQFVKNPSGSAFVWGALLPKL